MTLNVTIDKNIIESAKITACKIADKETRKRAYALNIAANAAAKCLDADTKQSLYKAPAFASNLELADIYIDGVRYDVRVSFNGKTFCIPKTHEMYEAVPCAYIVVHLENSLKEAEILGFISSSELEHEKTNTEYFCYETDVLKPIEEFKEFASSQSVKIHPYSTLDHDRIKEMCTGFIDNEITETEKIYFIKHVIACPVCRETFCDMNDFDTILCQLKNYPDLLDDSTLSVFAGNKAEFDSALLAGLAVVENEDDGILESDIPMLNLLDFTDNEEKSEEDEKPEPEAELEIEAETDELVDEVPEEEPFLPELAEDAELAELNEFTEEAGLEEIKEEAEEPVEQEEPETAEMEEQVDELEESNEIEEIADLEVLDGFDAQEELLEETIEESEPVEETLEAVTEEPEEIKEEELLIEHDSLDELHVEDNSLESHDLLEEIHPEEESLELHEVDTLEIEDLETLDSIEPVEEAPIETIEEEPEALDEISEIVEDEPLEEIVETEETEEDFGSLQEPVELNYENETELTEEEPSCDFSAEEPEEPVFENEITDEPEFEIQEESIEEAEQPEQPEQPEPDDEIQNLLDDDLLALLSDEPSSESDAETADSTDSDESFKPHFDESAFAMDPEEPQPEVGDDTIHSLFENKNEDGDDTEGSDAAFELAPEPVSASTVNKTKQIAIAAALVVLLAGAGAGAWFMNHQKPSGDEAPLDTANSDQIFDFQNKGSNGDESQDTQSAAVSQDINRSMANSFSDKPAAISITKISWQVSEKLASDASVKEYLQTAGKNIQMNLQNDLANAADVAFNNSVKVSIEIAPDNTLKGIQVLTSSGSDKIDDVILRSIKNTLKYVNVPKLKDYKSDYFLTLIINF